MTSLLSRLHRFIPEHYDLEELRTLCLDLGIKYDDLGGEGLSAKARELILWLGRRQQLDALLAALQQGRPGPFDKLGLGTDRVALDGLYAELPAFEASAGSIWRELWLGAQNIVAHHWPALLSLLVADGVLVLLYRGFRDRYLIRSWAGAGAVILATAAILGWYGLLGRRWQKTWLWAATLGTSLLFVGGLAWQVRQITQPAEFDPQTFGIAVALFGEGDSFRVTSLARDVTDQIYRGLDETIRDNPEWEAVQVRRVGLINREDQAREWGERVRADLVVWGQVVLVGTGNVSVHFEILQILDRVSSPVYPLVLPAQPAFAQITTEVVDAALETVDIKERVSRQGQIITAFSLGLATYFNRDYNTAVVQFEEAIETLEADDNGDASQDDKLGLVYFYLGRAYQRRGDLETGEEKLWEAEKYAPEDPAIPLSIAYGYDSMGRKEEAQELAQQAIGRANEWLSRYPDDVVVLYDQGLAYQLLDEPLRAAAAFDDILEQEPTFYIAYLSAGLSFLEADRTEQAIERFQAAIERAEESGTDSSWGTLFLAEAYEQAGEIQQAETFYRRAVELAPDVDWMHYRQGKFYERQDRSNEAEQAYQLMVNEAYDKVWARAEMAKFLRGQSRLEEAIDEFEYVRLRRVTDTLSQVYLAELYVETNRPELARKDFDEALERTPNLAYGHASYGRVLVQWGDYGAAISHFQTALELDAADCLTRFNLGRAYEANAELQEALETFQAILDAPEKTCSAEIRQGAQERKDVLLRLLSATPTPTETPVSTPTRTPTWTPQPTPTPTVTPQAKPMDTPTPTPPLTSLPSPSGRPTTLATPTSTRTPTPIPTAVPPELVEPFFGATYQNPVTFKWTGALNSGEAYQVTAYHSESDYRMQSEPQMTQQWIKQLPPERFGQWRWWVAVIRNGQIAAKSPEGMFWFDPFPTPTLPAVPTPTNTPRPAPPPTNTPPPPTPTLPPAPTPTLTRRPGPTHAPTPTLP